MVLPARGRPAGMRPGSCGTCPTQVTRWRRLQTLSHRGELPPSASDGTGSLSNQAPFPSGPPSRRGTTVTPAIQGASTQFTQKLSALPGECLGVPLRVTHSSSRRTQPHLSAIPWEHWRAWACP